MQLPTSCLPYLAYPTRSLHGLVLAPPPQTKCILCTLRQSGFMFLMVSLGPSTGQPALLAHTDLDLVIWISLKVGRHFCNVFNFFSRLVSLLGTLKFYFWGRLVTVIGACQTTCCPAAWCASSPSCWEEGAAEVPRSGRCTKIQEHRGYLQWHLTWR